MVERLGSGRIGSQVAQVFVESPVLVQNHPPEDSPPKRGSLVEAEIHARSPSYQGDYLSDGVLGRVLRIGILRYVRVPSDAGQLGCDFPRRQG